MSNNKSTQQLTIEVPTETDGTHVQTQYGIRFPDGHTEWGTVKTPDNIQLNAQYIVTGSNYDTTQRWQKALAGRAEMACIQLSEYTEAHTYLKRQVILVTTAPEEV